MEPYKKSYDPSGSTVEHNALVSWGRRVECGASGGEKQINVSSRTDLPGQRRSSISSLPLCRGDICFLQQGWLNMVELLRRFIEIYVAVILTKLSDRSCLTGSKLIMLFRWSTVNYSSPLKKKKVNYTSSKLMCHSIRLPIKCIGQFIIRFFNENMEILINNIFTKLK